MNFKKISLVLMAVTLGFATETFAKFTVGPVDKGDRKTTIRKARSVKSQDTQKTDTREKSIARSSARGVNKRFERRPAARRNSGTAAQQHRCLARTHSTRTAAQAQQHRCLARTHSMRTATQAQQNRRPAVRRSSAVATPVQQNRRPAAAVGRKTASPAPTFTVPEQNGQWNAAYQLNNGKFVKRTRNGIEYDGFRNNQGIQLGKGLILNGQHFTNDVNLTMDKSQVEFLQEVSKLGVVTRVIPLQ